MCCRNIQIGSIDILKFNIMEMRKTKSIALSKFSKTCLMPFCICCPLEFNNNKNNSNNNNNNNNNSNNNIIISSSSSTSNTSSTSSSSSSSSSCSSISEDRCSLFLK